MLTRPARLALIDREDPELPIKTQAELLGLNRSGIYYQPVPISERELQLRHRIDEIYTQLPFYGSRRITKILQREGWQVGREVVQGHMRAMGIAGICPGPNLSKRDHQLVSLHKNQAEKHKSLVKKWAWYGPERLPKTGSRSTF